jgi:regulator of sigma E protease
VVIFGLIIFIHELGHFVAAKLSGIAVLQFSIGFGPALLKKQVGETLYALRIIPLGGAVMMKGADDEEEILVGKQGEAAPVPSAMDADDEAGSFYAAPKWKRLIVLAAGPLMNLLCGLVIIFILWIPARNLSMPVIGELMDGFPYGQYFQVGDRLTSVNGFHIFTADDISVALSVGAGRPMDFVLERGGQTIRLNNLDMEATVPDPDTGRLLYGFRFAQKPATLGGVAAYAGAQTMTYLQSAVKSLQMLFTGQAGVKDMMGTVGIASQISSAVQVSAGATWDFVAFISVNIAFMNLLPIPALDGGKLLFLAIEAVRRKRVSAKVEGAVSLASLVLILGLFVVVTYNDIARIVAG